MTKILHGQLTPMWQSQTQNLELNKIKTTYQNNVYYKKKTKKHLIPTEIQTPPECLTTTEISETHVAEMYGIKI